MPSVSVVAAVVLRDGRYLVGRRPPEKRHGDLWEFPGGKLHEGENLLDAARRELREELHLGVVRSGSEVFSSRDPGSPFVIRFLEIDVEGEPTPTEHTQVGWYTADELADMPLAPSDAAFVSFLRSSPG